MHLTAGEEHIVKEGRGCAERANTTSQDTVRYSAGAGGRRGLGRDGFVTSTVEIPDNSSRTSSVLTPGHRETAES